MGLISGLWFFLICMTMLVLVVASLWLLVEAFSEHFLWGLALLFIPMAYVVFSLLNWEKAAKPFLLGLAALGVLMVEMLITGGVSAMLGH